MFHISYEYNNFFVEYKSKEFLDREQLEEILLYFRQLFLSYNIELRKFKIPKDRLDEVILWFEKDGKDYTISKEAGDQFEILKNNYKREVEFYRGKTFDASILNEGIKAFDYQIKAINYRLQRNITEDAFDAGTGKTFINICVASQRYKEGLIDSIIILVPVGMSFHWKYEILKFVNIFKEEDIQIIDNDNKIKPFEKYIDKKILIIRHDFLAHHLASYRKDYTPKKSLKTLKWKSSTFVDIKKAWNKNNIQLLIDEAHNFKNTSAIRTKALFNIKDYFKYRINITATPAINGIEDVYANLSFLDKSIIPMSENAFKLWLSKDIGNKFDRYAIKSYNTQNVSTLMLSYQHIWSQIRKEDLEEIKTNKFINVVNFELNKLQQELYHKITDYELRVLQEEYDKITWRILLSKIHLILEVFDNPLLLAKRKYDSKDINNLIAKYNIEQDAKFIYLKNRIEDICDIQGKKLIVYDIHPDTLNFFYTYFKKYNPLIIHGQVKTKNKDKERKEIEDLFNYNDNHRIIFLSAYTSSAGINLQHGGSNILVYTLAWDATLFRQLQDRTWRATSTQDSFVEVLNYPYSLDRLRTNRNLFRIELNNKMDQEISQNDLNRLLNGHI